MFTINGVEHSVSSEHNLTEDKCNLSGVVLTDTIKFPPFLIGKSDEQRGYEKFVLVESNPYYVCVPTSVKGLD